MHYTYRDPKTKGHLLLAIDQYFPAHTPPARDGGESASLLTIAWNRGADQTVTVDEVTYAFPHHQFVTLMANQSFRFSKPEALTIWQFNREFYCIIDHDREVSCVGLLFYGSSGMMFLEPAPHEVEKFDMLTRVFIDEFETHDTIQGEMLRMLLKRLIIKLTRLAREQYLSAAMGQTEVDILRHFNLLVEKNFRQLHQVQEYAHLLNRSPKTLSNLFAQYHHQSPLQVIRERIAIEAKRLLLYTDKTVAEVAYETGFAETAHFSRFFKKETGLAPAFFREQQKLVPAGSIDNV